MISSVQGQEEVSVRGSGNGQCGLSRPTIVRAVLVLVASTLLLAIFAVALALERGSAGKISQPLPFCCPSEALQLVSIVNNAVGPCENLYAYVCTDVIKNGTGRSAMLLKSLEEVIAGFAAPPAERFASPAHSLTSSRAGIFLKGLYSSCLAASTAKPLQDEDGHNAPVHFVQMAAALWDIGRELLVHLNESNLLAFLLMVNFRYETRSVVEIEYSSSDATFLFYHDALELDSEMHLACMECVTAALLAYNRFGQRSTQDSNSSFLQQANSTPLTFDDVGVFASHLHSLYPKRRVVERFVMANLSELWPANQFIDALSMLSWVLTLHDLSIESFAPHQLVILREQITNAKNRAVGAIYLVAHTVARSYLTIPSVLSIENAHQVCMTLTTTMKALVSTVYWDLYSSPDKETVVMDMYKSVLETVALEAASMLLLPEAVHDAKHPLRAFLTNITLVTEESIHLDASQVPEPTHADFARNLLLGRSFQFEVRKKRHKLNLPGSLSEADPVLRFGVRYYLEVPAPFYSVVPLLTLPRFLRIGRGPNPINAAVLGVPLAELLWTAVLRNEWGADIEDYAEQLTRCFSDVSPRGSDGLSGSLNDNYAETVRLAAASLALRTMMRTMPREDWYAAQDADWNYPHLRRLSHVHFFFLLQTYFKCPNEKLRPDEVYVNVSSAYVPEFESAFECSSSPVMDRLRDCVNWRGKPV